MAEAQFSSEGRQSTKERRVKELGEPGDKVPESYCTNSSKEALCLEFVRNFRDKFQTLFPDRQLFLICNNEYGIPKFVSTTLRPTLLPFRQVYDVSKLASFVANFLDYEPLDDPCAPPATLPSPTQTLSWGVGDCFDFSMLLASYLLGAGYDAFVVYGTAPKWITLRDQAHSRCPMLDEAADAKDGEEGEGVGLGGGDDADEKGAKPAKASAKGDDDDDGGSKYEPRPRGVPESKYEADRERERLARDAKAADDWESEGEDDDALRDAETSDELRGKRTHAWVLVRGGKRDTHDMFFVESTTGRIFPTHDSPYLGIEAIWNSKNYWVNMQGDKAVSAISFDTLNTELWEYVFIDPANKLATAGGDDENMFGEQQDNLDSLESAGAKGGDAAGDDDDDDENVLDMPPSWVGALAVSRTDFALSYPPYGQRTVLYFKAKLELFAEHTHDQGMVSRLTVYKDRARTIVKECREAFTHRRDRLASRVRYPLEGKVRERFLPGRQLSLKELVEWAGRRRELTFFVRARQDGLACREEEIGSKIIERFEGRGDNLVYRSVSVKEDRTGGSKPQYTLPGGGQAGELVVQKMTQKFARSDAKPADQDVAKRTFYVQEGSIRTLYHYAEGRITRATKRHIKDRHGAPGSSSAAGGGDEGGDDAGESLQTVLAAERDCLQEVRRSQLEDLELRRLRRLEDGAVFIDKPIFDSAHERQLAEAKGADAAAEEEGEADRLQVDYLTPFVQNAADPKSISREEAQRARDACLKSLKDRLLERANIIQTRLNEENAKLAKRQATFQRNQRDNDPSAEEEFEKFCSEAMFRIQILEQRLVNHEETALKKYQELDERLSVDPRLNVLTNA